MPVVTLQVLTRDLEPEVVRQEECTSERSVEHGAFTTAEVDRGALVVQRRLGEDLQHAVSGVGSVERRPGTQDHLHALHVVVGRRDEVHEVHPERGDAGQAMVLHHVEGAREDVVESPQNDVVGLDPLRDDVDAGCLAEVLREGGVRRCRCVDLTLGDATGGAHDDPVESQRHGGELDVADRGLARRHADPIHPGGAMAHLFHDDGVSPRCHVDAVHTRLVRERSHRGSASEDLNLGSGDGSTRPHVSHGTSDDSLLGRQCSGQEESHEERTQRTDS